LLHRQKLFTEDFVLAVPISHPLADTAGLVDVSVLATENVLLLEEGHCLRDQALAVCQLAGASERTGFRATSLETLRQMVAAGVGITLLPELAVQPPVSTSDDVKILHFREPVPRREIAMFWRETTAYPEFLPKLAAVMADLPAHLTGISHASA
jgi:LysR family hydrogen peroxide-inducible transcriptional activator